MSDQGKRREERVPVNVRVKLKFADVDSFLDHYSLNISRGGVFIQANPPRPVGTVVRFELQLADASPAIRGEGRVVWVKGPSSGVPEAEVGMGLRFTRIDARSKALIDRAVTLKAARGIADTPGGPPEPVAAGADSGRRTPAPGGQGQAGAENGGRAKVDVDALLSGDVDPRAILKKFLAKSPIDAGSLDSELQALAQFKPKREPPTEVVPPAAARTVEPARGKKRASSAPPPPPPASVPAPAPARAPMVAKAGRTSASIAPPPKQAPPRAKLPIDIPDDLDFDAQFDAMMGSGAPQKVVEPPAPAEPEGAEFYRGEPIVPAVEVDVGDEAVVIDEGASADDLPFEEGDVVTSAPNVPEAAPAQSGGSGGGRSEDAEIDDLFSSLETGGSAPPEEETVLDEDLISADLMDGEAPKSSPPDPAQPPGGEKRGLFRKIFGGSGGGGK